MKSGKLVDLLMWLICFIGSGIFLQGGEVILSPEKRSTLEIRPSLRFGGLDVPEDQMFSHPVDLTVGSDGRIFILDSRDHNVKVFNRDGTFRHTFSREGSGPGELQRPWIISTVGDELFIADTGNQRVQVFSLQGEYKRGYKVSLRLGSGMAFDDQGQLYRNTQGFRSSTCLAVTSSSGDLVREFAELDGKPFEYYDFTEIRRAISEGEIPSSFRNDALPAVAPDGKVWMVYRSLPKFKTFSPHGQLLGEFPIECAAYPEIYQNFRTENEKLANQPSTYFPLRYVNDLTIDEAGNLLVLINHGTGMQILVYTSQGELERTFLGPRDPIARMCFGPEGNLFALSAESHFIYRFDLRSDSDTETRLDPYRFFSLL